MKKIESVNKFFNSLVTRSQKNKYKKMIKLQYNNKKSLDENLENAIDLLTEIVKTDKSFNHLALRKNKVNIEEIASHVIFTDIR